LDRDTNAWFIEVEGLRLVIRQARPDHIDDMKVALKGFHHSSWWRYTGDTAVRLDFDVWCGGPYFELSDAGRFYFTMWIDGECIGFCNVNVHGEGTERMVHNGVAIVNRWQRKGIGSLWGRLTEVMALDFGAYKMYSETRTEPTWGTYHLRLRQGGWRELRRFRKFGGEKFIAMEKIIRE
jgi:RimJ/RimL family protein N-acetyltransferase